MRDMNRPNALRVLITTIGLLCAGWSSAQTGGGFQTQGDITRASDWLGSVVMTQDGRELGKVQDLAIDKQSGKMKYVVVSVGSFLIESSLIAVDPAALMRTNGGALVLIASDSDLQQAKRFANDQWPLQANLIRSGEAPAEIPSLPQVTSAGTETAPASVPASGTATIADANKIAYLTGGERSIQETPASPTPPPTATTPPETKTASDQNTERADRPATKFDRQDTDGDGVLNRAEIAHEITYKDSYTELDENANGVIDRDEFDRLQEQRGGGE
jgi:sporulation protein YlmC with PRC-barrel domain